MPSNTSLVGKDLSGRDLRNFDLTGRVLFGADLRGAKLHGARVSLTCETFDGAKFDDDQVAMLLAMLTNADITEAWKAGLLELVERMTGPDRCRAIERLLKVI